MITFNVKTNNNSFRYVIMEEEIQGKWYTTMFLGMPEDTEGLNTLLINLQKHPVELQDVFREDYLDKVVWYKYALCTYQKIAVADAIAYLMNLASDIQLRIAEAKKQEEMYV